MSDFTFLQNRLDQCKEALDQLDNFNAIDFAKEVYALRGTTNKVIFMGNGASYTIANHAALDYMSQTGVQTLCVADPAVLTAFSNDFGYENALERFCKINYKEGDILVCVSSSGNSPNVVNAAKYVKSVGGNVVAFTGFSEYNDLSQIVNKNFWVDSVGYNVVESIHNLWLAMICDLMIEWMGDNVGLHGLNL